MRQYAKPSISEMSVNAYRDIKNGMDTAMKEGIEKGVKKTAQRMKALNVPVEDISMYTGLSVEEINEL